MPRVFQMLRRRRPLLQATILRRHSARANHPNPDPRLPAHHGLHPANDTPAGVQVLDETARREAAATYAATVAAHLRRRDFPRAEALFRAAPASVRGAHLDAVMLDGYVKAGCLERARRLFDGMAKKDEVAWTTMVSGYCHAGFVDEARQLFDKMPARNVVSWTAMLQGYVRAGMLSEAREMFDTMPMRNVVTWTVMVKAYADGGHITKALGLFHRMPWRNSYSWNAIISGLLRAGRVDEAVHLFERMHHKTLVSWTVMVTGLAQNGRVWMARKFFYRMPKNKDITACNAMITAYAKNSQMNQARKLFDSMPAKDQMSWNIVMDGYAKNELKDEAMELFLLMLRSAVSPTSTTLISALVASESTDEVAQIHGIATKIGLLSETSLGNTLLTRYSRSDSLHSAWEAFKMLQEKDAITWTSMMQAFANHGHASYALQAFAQMLRHGHNPSSTTFTAALSACRHAGLVEKGRNIFRSIRRVYGIEPTIEHHDILCRTVRARVATKVVAVVPPELHDQEMELKERERKSEKESVENGQLAIEEPAAVEAAAAAAATTTEYASTKTATISVATLQATEIVAAMLPELHDQEMELKERERKSEKESVENGRLAIEEPAGVEAAAAATTTEYAPTKTATISVATSQATEVVAVMPPEKHDQGMELKEWERESEKESVEDSQLAMKEPSGAAAAECTPTKSASISVSTLQSSYLWLSKKMQAFLSGQKDYHKDEK